MQCGQGGNRTPSGLANGFTVRPDSPASAPAHENLRYSQCQIQSSYQFIIELFKRQDILKLFFENHLSDSTILDPNYDIESLHLYVGLKYYLNFLNQQLSDLLLKFGHML